MCKSIYTENSLLQEKNFTEREKKISYKPKHVQDYNSFQCLLDQMGKKQDKERGSWHSRKNSKMLNKGEYL